MFYVGCFLIGILTHVIGYGWFKPGEGWTINPEGAITNVVLVILWTILYYVAKDNKEKK